MFSVLIHQTGRVVPPVKFVNVVIEIALVIIFFTEKKRLKFCTWKSNSACRPV